MPTTGQKAARTLLERTDFARAASVEMADANRRRVDDTSFRAFVREGKPNGLVDVEAQNSDGSTRIIRDARPTIGGYPLVVGDSVQVWRDSDGAVNCQAEVGGFYSDGIRDASFLARVDTVYKIRRALPSGGDTQDLTTRMDCTPLKERSARRIHAFATTETVGVERGSQVWLVRDDGGAVAETEYSYTPRYFAGSGERLPADFYNGTNPRPAVSLALGYADLAVGTNQAEPKERALNYLIASVEVEVDNRDLFANAPTLQPNTPFSFAPSRSSTIEATNGKLKILLSERAERIGVNLEVTSGVDVTLDERSADDITNRRYVFSVGYAAYTTVIYIDAYLRTVPGSNRYILIIDRNEPYN